MLGDFGPASTHTHHTFTHYTPLHTITHQHSPQEVAVQYGDLTLLDRYLLHELAVLERDVAAAYRV